MTTPKDLLLAARIRVLSKFGGKTKFTFWTDVEVDDILLITNNLTRWGSNIEVENERTGEKFEITSNRHIDNYLNLWDNKQPIKWEPA
tara:strand:+ start:1626 stop:1889 length:264 start_codon:yes stop_codon:yes gene_type:complete